MATNDDEEERLRSVALKNARSILLARQRAEEALRKQSEWLRVTLSSIGDGVISTDAEGAVTFMNGVAESLTGCSQAEASGRPLSDVFHIINEDSRQPVENPALRVLREGVIVGLANHTVLIRKDGTELPIDDSAAPIRDEQGKMVGCVLVFREVSERRRAESTLQISEERFRSLVTATISVVWTTDEAGRFVTEQPSWAAYTGQTWEEYRDFGWADALHADDRERVRALWDAARATRTLYKSNGRVWHADSGTYRHFEARGVPVCKADGSVREWVGRCMDVEDQRQVELRIYRLLNELRESDRKKDEFLATLAHELRGPLAPVRNSLEIMKRAEANPGLLEQARITIDRQVSHLERLVDDLLDVARISRNLLELRKQRVELAPVVHQAVETCRPLADSSRHAVTVTLPPEPTYLNADPVRLAQVFSNLLNNACKYTEPGGHIWLTAERQGSDVTVSVKDAGVGIPPEMLPRVFEMFTQIDRSSERSQGGLGIGLALVRRLVEMHDGRIEAFSDGAGRGSEFVVRLPLFVEKPKAPRTEPTVGKQATTARRILVVDDNRDAAASLAMLLQLIGNETFSAGDGLEAVEAVEKFRPDVVLLDIGLPRLNGHDAARRIREQPWGKDIVLVALTGWGQDEDRRKSREAGFDTHMVKPVDLDALVMLLGSLPSEQANQRVNR